MGERDGLPGVDRDLPVAGRRLHVVGAGLIGTSVGLAAALAGWTVTFEDRDPAQAEHAQARLAAATGGPAPAVVSPPSRADLVCVAVPPAATSAEVLRALESYPEATVIDVASVKSEPRRAVEAESAHAGRYVPTHPLAGGEGQGPDAGRFDLFLGRSWVVCATTGSDRVPVVLELVAACGAHPVWLSAEDHDRLLAVTSHLPQLLASALAAEVASVFEPAAGDGGGARTGDVPASSLAGPALWDMTRIAASPTELWSQIAALNHPALRVAVQSLQRRLRTVEDALIASSEAAAGVGALLDAGRAARSQLGAKHRAADVPRRAVRTQGVDGAVPDAGWTWVELAIDDTPGTLARVFATAGVLDINVEDVRVDHAPYASTGLVSVAVRDAVEARALQAALDDPR